MQIIVFQFNVLLLKIILQVKQKTYILLSSMDLCVFWIHKDLFVCPLVSYCYGWLGMQL